MDSDFDKKKTLNDKLKKCSVDFCEDTSTHGLGNIVKTDSWVIRIIWIVLVLAGTVYCTYCNLIQNKVSKK